MKGRISIRKELKFECGHRLYEYEGKCCNIHGHNYKAMFYFKSIDSFCQMDSTGMVIDFGDIKKGIGKWLDDNWDHAIVLFEKDKEALDTLLNSSFKVATMPYNPTAESMALYLFEEICPEIYKDSSVYVYKIEVYENDESCAIVEEQK